MDVTSFDEVRSVLKKYVPKARQFEAAYTLDNMTRLMDELGNPQDTYRVVHIAGTSGKTSTAYYISGFLAQSGAKVGLTVSPHIDELNERLQVNLLPVEENVYCDAFNRFMTIIDSCSVKPTYFELLVAFAYWYFAEQKVDYAVIEVGLGGLLDGTNVVTRPDKTCIITDIGLDHTQVLGKSISKITSQKTGIIKPHNVVIAYAQSEEVDAIIQEVAAQQHAELHQINPKKNGNISEDMPLFQRRNWFLAYCAYECVKQKDNLPSLTNEQLQETTKIYIPGRMETVQIGNKVLIMDGAHNAQKLSMLRRSVKQLYPDAKIATLFSIIQSRNERLESSLAEVAKFSDTIICTSFATEQDLSKVSASSSKVVKILERLKHDRVYFDEDPRNALERLMGRPEEVLVVTGSFYLLNVIRPFIKR